MQALDKLHDSYDNPQIEYLKMASLCGNIHKWQRSVNWGIWGKNKTKQNRKQLAFGGKLDYF